MAEVAKFYNRLGLTPVSADPASPNQGEYQESDGTHREAGLWRYDGTEWVQIKGGSGINYLEDAANADSWTDDTNFTVTENTSSPLRAPRDLLLSKAAVDASTETVSIPFSIDDADLAKVLPLTFEYKSDSAYIDGDYEIEIYDVTNAAVISNSAPAILANELGNTHRTYFQTAVDSNSYELRIKVVTTSATASSMQIDSPFCGPEKLAASQTIVSDWVDFTPTGTHTTNATYSGKYRRVGGDVEIQYNVEYSGSTDATGLLFDLPSGLSVDETKIIPHGTSPEFRCGDGTSLNTGSDLYVLSANYDTSLNQIRARVHDHNADSVEVTSRQLGSTVPFVPGSGDSVNITVRLPIQGWESGTKPSEIISGREVSAIYECDSSQALSGTTTVLFNVEDHDSTGSYDTGTGIYTVPESGRYSIDSHCLLDTTSWSGSSFVSIRINLNGTDVKQSLDSFDATVTNTKMVHISSLLDLQKGDELKVDIGVPTSTNLNSLPKNNYLNISKLNSASSQIAPTETVAARYDTSATTSITNNTDTTLLYDNKIRDTHGSYNTGTGIYTAPISGWYHVTAKAKTAMDVASSEGHRINIDVNSTTVSSVTEEFNGSNVSNVSSAYIDDTLYLEAGDELEIVYRIINNTSASLSGSASENNFSIIKVGN